MRIIARKKLVGFWETHPETKATLVRWEAVTKAARWATTAEVNASFSGAKILNGERLCFEITGGDYRLIVAFDFIRKVVFVKFIGTHKEYDAIDALSINLF